MGIFFCSGFALGKYYFFLGWKSVLQTYHSYYLLFIDIIVENYIEGSRRRFVYQCHPILWTASKLYGKNHMLIVLLSHHIDQSSKIIFSDLLSDI